MDSGLPQKKSKHLQEKLYEPADHHECICDVRGIGHFAVLEIVKNRKTKQPFDVKADKLSGKALMTGKIAADSMKNGLYMVFWYDTLFIAPPLIITVEQIDEGIDILDKSLAIGDKEVVSTDVPAYPLRSNQMKQVLKLTGSLAVTKSRTYYIAWELPRRNWTNIFSV